MNRRTKWWIAGSTIALMSSAGFACLVEANPAPVVVISQQPNRQTVEENGDGQNDDLAEQQQVLRWQSQAKITLHQAIRSAEANQQGKATGAELEAEDSNLVYAIDIGLKEVTIDAGNGQVLAVSDLSQSESRSPRWRSSVQVSGSTAGDGDGETEDDG